MPTPQVHGGDYSDLNNCIEMTRASVISRVAVSVWKQGNAALWEAAWKEGKKESEEGVVRVRLYNISIDSATLNSAHRRAYIANQSVFQSCSQLQEGCSDTHNTLRTRSEHRRGSLAFDTI